MKDFGKFWLSFAAPFLVIISILGLLHRKDNDRVQIIPAFAIGSGLMISSVFNRYMARKKLLFEFNKSNEEEG